MKLDTNVIKKDKIFKNYKELCICLDEPIHQGGKQRQLQLKDWERYFSYKKEGYKFIITEVFDTPKEKIDKRSNGNRSKYVQPFMDYVMSTFDKKYIGEYFTISNWTTIILKLLDKDTCNSIYKDDEELYKLCGDLGISDVKLYRNYISTVKSTTRDFVIKTFGWLQKRGYIEYQDGHKFYYEGEKYNKTVSTNEVDDLIDSIEREICQEIIKDKRFQNKKIVGKQLIYILQHNKDKKLLQQYMDMRIKALNENDDICSAVNDAIWEKDASSPDYVDGENRHLLSVYKCFQISACNDYPKVENMNIKQDVINIIEDISLRHMMNIKYKRHGLEYHPYNNEFSRDEIEKINNVLFRDIQKIVTFSEIVDELDEELDEIFNLDYAS